MIILWVVTLVVVGMRDGFMKSYNGPVCTQLWACLYSNLGLSKVDGLLAILQPFH